MNSELITQNSSVSWLGPGHRPTVQHSYPHMLIEDADTWRGYLKNHPIPFELCWYDVHCGIPVRVPDGSPEFMMKVALGVTRKRIDVLARTPEAYLVIEIKPVLSSFALGQALCYTEILREEHTWDRPLVPSICCAELDEDIAPIADRMGITILLV